MSSFLYLSMSSRRHTMLPGRGGTFMASSTLAPSHAGSLDALLALRTDFRDASSLSVSELTNSNIVNARGSRSPSGIPAVVGSSTIFSRN